VLSDVEDAHPTSIEAAERVGLFKRIGGLQLNAIGPSSSLRSAMASSRSFSRTELSFQAIKDRFDIPLQGGSDATNHQKAHAMISEQHQQLFERRFHLASKPIGK
jgi:hypothetical protein